MKVPKTETETTTIRSEQNIITIIIKGAECEYKRCFLRLTRPRDSQQQKPENREQKTRSRKQTTDSKTLENSSKIARPKCWQVSGSGAASVDVSVSVSVRVNVCLSVDVSLTLPVFIAQRMSRQTDVQKTDKGTDEQMLCTNINLYFYFWKDKTVTHTRTHTQQHRRSKNQRVYEKR